MQLTAPELAIHKLLWQQAPLTGMEIHQKVGELYQWSYSSTRKTLERMVIKKTMRVETRKNKNIYFSQLEKIPTLAAYAEDFTNRVLEIDGPLPIAMFSDSQLIKKEEIGELEELLEHLHNKKS